MKNSVFVDLWPWIGLEVAEPARLDDLLDGASDAVSTAQAGFFQAGSEVARLEQQIQHVRDSRSRVVEFLVQLTQAKGQAVGFEWVIRKPITHQEIANLTATSRQTVTTTLNDLRFKKLLTFNRARLLVRDLEALKAEIRP